jgi:hypothetical protein
LAVGSLEALAMANFRRLLVAAIGAFSLLGATGVSVAASEGNKLIEFDSMTGVSAAVALAQKPNDRGILPGGAPWVISSGVGSVDRQGNVSVRVNDLIIPTLTPPHNPVGAFSATVSCVTPHGVVNVTTGPFKASVEGDSTIKAKVALPHRCNNPEVFVGLTRPNGLFVWFAMSNSEEQEQEQEQEQE